MYKELNALLEELTNNKIIPAVSMSIGYMSEIIYSESFGEIAERNKKICNNTRFDIASMTKILTGICFIKLVEEGKVSLSDPICDIFPEFNNKKPIEKDGCIVGYCDSSKITWYNVLTHTSGMGWTRSKTRPSLPNLDKGLSDIYNMPFAYVPGEHIVYSDIPIILMGKAIEQLSNMKLDDFVDKVLCKPLNMKNTSFLRISNNTMDKALIAPTEEDLIFRKRRVWGEVHDENAYLLDGVSAHAGIFSTSEDMCNLAIHYNNWLHNDGILKKESVKQMILEHVEENGDRRGLIWQLSGDGEKAYTKNLSRDAYGHAGFTGCFLWNDPVTSLSIVFLSNDVYNGRDNRKLFDYRSRIMNIAIKDTLGGI